MSRILILFIMIALILQPIYIKNVKNAYAGPTITQSYTNAPSVVVGGTVNSSNEIVSATPLFSKNGLNADVFLDLLKKINNADVWKRDGQDVAMPQGEEVKYLSAKNFSQVNGKTDAQILIKLFDTLSTSGNTNSINDFTTIYWQTVYRSISSSKDVLTLYMTKPYMQSAFDDAYGDYTQSALRQLVLNTYKTLSENFSSVDQYVVKPSELPGLWQSAEYQTGRSNTRALWTGGVSSTGGQATGWGATGHVQSTSTYGIGNGMDGLNDRFSQWGNQDTSTYSDKLWVPSGYETMYTSYYQTSESEILHDTGRYIDGTELVSYVATPSSASTALSNMTSSKDSRTGLWELNGYDRASNNWSWLRSGRSNYANHAKGVRENGNIADSAVTNSAYWVRVAIHLDVNKMLNTLFSKIDASQTTGDLKIVPQLSGGVTTEDVSGMTAAWQNDLMKFVKVNSAETKGTKVLTYNFDTTKYNLKVNIGGQILLLNNSSGSGTINNFCDYSYTKSSSNIALTLKNVKQNLSITSEISGRYVVLYQHGVGATGSDCSYTENVGVSHSIKGAETLNFAKLGYHIVNFLGDDGKTYNIGGAYSGNKDIVLTAQWQANNYAVVFNANAPSGESVQGSMANQNFVYGVAQNLSKNKFVLEKYEFLGWATTPSGDVVYKESASVNNLTSGNNGRVTLYAKWQKIIYNFALNVNNNLNDTVMLYLIENSTNKVYSYYLTKSTTLHLTANKNTTFSVIVYNNICQVEFVGNGTKNAKKFTFEVNADNITYEINILSKNSNYNDVIII